MATIGDYASLVAAITAWSHRQNLTTYIDYLIQAAQEQVEKDIIDLNVGSYIRPQENSYPSVAIDANGYAPIPSDWLGPKLLTITGENVTRTLIFKSPQWIYERYRRRSPGSFPQYVARDLAATNTGWPTTGGSLSFTATNGQTGFSLSAGPVNTAVLVVALDGAILSPGTDYTIIGSQLTLTTPAIEGQVLLVQFAASGLAPPTPSNSEVLIFGPFPCQPFMVQGTYYAKAAPLSAANTTNWMVSLAPNVLHAACMVQAGLFIPDDKMVARWQPTYQQRLKALVDISRAETWAAGTLVMSSP